MSIQTILLFTFVMLLFCSAQSMLVDDIGGITSYETGISDVKSIIMEKYGRHYRLTGGSSMLATKRNKPDMVVIETTNNVENAPSRNNSVNDTVDSKDVANSNVNNTVAGVMSLINGTDSASSNRVNVSTNNKSDISDVNNHTTDAVGRDDVANFTDEAVSREKVDSNKDEPSGEKVVHLTASKNESKPDSTKLVFGTPPEKPKWIAEGENNYTSEGNLTTINIDLTKGEVPIAVIPDLDIHVSPLTQVDIVYGSNETNTPKRSEATSALSGTVGKKPRKNIVFQINKPKMAINDFANKRKHVPHRTRGSSSNKYSNENKKRSNKKHKSGGLSHKKKSKIARHTKL